MHDENRRRMKYCVGVNVEELDSLLTKKQHTCTDSLLFYSFQFLTSIDPAHVAHPPTKEFMVIYQLNLEVSIIKKRVHQEKKITQEKEGIKDRLQVDIYPLYFKVLFFMLKLEGNKKILRLQKLIGIYHRLT